MKPLDEYLLPNTLASGGGWPTMRTCGHDDDCVTYLQFFGHKPVNSFTSASVMKPEPSSSNASLIACNRWTLMCSKAHSSLSLMGRAGTGFRVIPKLSKSLVMPRSCARVNILLKKKMIILTVGCVRRFLSSRLYLSCSAKTKCRAFTCPGHLYRRVSVGEEMEK